MSSWIRRNAAPIAIVALASVVVVGLFELLDAAVGSGPVADGVENAELEGLASVAGLIKVAVVLAIGALIAQPIHRRFRGQPR